MRANAGGHNNSADVCASDLRSSGRADCCFHVGAGGCRCDQAQSRRTAHRRRAHECRQFRVWCADAPAEVGRDPALRTRLATHQYLADLRRYRRHAGHVRPLADLRHQPPAGAWTRRELGRGCRLQADQAGSAQGRSVPQRARVHQRRRQVHARARHGPDEDLAVESGWSGQRLDRGNTRQVHRRSSSPSSHG